MIKRKLLVLEDDKDLCETTASFLSNSGFECITAFNGAEGIQKTFEHFPDLVLCDIAMPVIDGYEVYNILQESQVTATIPFIFITAKVEKEDIRLGMQMGVDDYITKPFDFNDMLISINKRLEKYSKIKKFQDERLRTLFDNSPYMVYIYFDGKYIYTNKNFLNQIGYSIDEIVDKPLSFNFIETDRDIIDAKVREITAIDSSVQIHTQIMFRRTIAKPVIAQISRLFYNNNLSYIVFMALQPVTNELHEEFKESLEEEVSKVVENAVKVLESNREIISEALLEKLKNVFGSEECEEAEIKYSKRELEVLELICKGHSNLEISEQLYLSPRTIERHRSNMLNKTNSKKLIEVIIYAIKHNLIQI